MSERLKPEIEIPFDIVYHIFLRLPVKTLRRFRCVSKRLCSLISDPTFQKDHTLHAQQNPLFLVTDGNLYTTYNNDGSLLRKFGPFFTELCSFGPKSFRVIQSSSPLPLVCLTHYSFDSIHLCNPTTGEMKILPTSWGRVQISVGFGFAASTKQFKVVRFSFREEFELKEVHCDVFTVGTNDGWREARSPPPYEPYCGIHPPFLHGALHLLPAKQLALQDDHYIAAFDVDTEEYRGIPLPDIYFRKARSEEMRGDNAEFLKLVGLRGSLCLAFDHTVTKKMLELWFLKDYHGGNWVKQYNLDLSSVSYISAYPSAISHGCILLNINPERGQGTNSRWYDTTHNCFAKAKVINSEATFYIESFLPLGGWKCGGR